MMSPRFQLIASYRCCFPPAVGGKPLGEERAPGGLCCALTVVSPMDDQLAWFSIVLTTNNNYHHLSSTLNLYKDLENEILTLLIPMEELLLTAARQ